MCKLFSYSTMLLGRGTMNQCCIHRRAWRFINTECVQLKTYNKPPARHTVCSPNVFQMNSATWVSKASPRCPLVDNRPARANHSQEYHGLAMLGLQNARQGQPHMSGEHCNTFGWGWWAIKLISCSFTSAGCKKEHAIQHITKGQPKVRKPEEDIRSK